MNQQIKDQIEDIKGQTRVLKSRIFNKHTAEPPTRDEIESMVLVLGIIIDIMSDMTSDSKRKGSNSWD